MGKEKSTASHSAATDAPTAPAGFLARLLPTARGKLIVIGSLSATIIGTIAALALIYQPSFQHIGILSLEFHVDKLSRPLL